MNLKFEEESEDIRGKMLFLSYGDKKINIFEIKKGFSRAGHFHTFETEQIIISGNVEYREENANTKQEETRTVCAPAIIKIQPYNPHLVTALEDTILVEVFGKDYNATNYPKYRQIVEQKMKSDDNQQ